MPASEDRRTSRPELKWVKKTARDESLATIVQKGLTEAVTPFLKQKGWDGKPNSFITWWRRTHFENLHALRELDDRRVVRPRAHALSADWRARGFLRDGSLRHPLE